MRRCGAAVVPVNGQPWDTDPFKPVVKDGKLYGRGACDMKGFIGVSLALLPEMQAAHLKQPLHFALSYDEEIGCVGAPVMLTSGPQLEGPIEDLRYWADLIETYSWEQDLGHASPMGIPTHRRLLKEAVGVVGAITPWNFPHQINFAKLGPALAAGNTIVLKPAPDTPWCAAIGVENVVPTLSCTPRLSSLPPYSRRPCTRRL